MKLRILPYAFVLAVLIAAPVYALHTGQLPRGSQSYLGVDITDASDEQVAQVMHLRETHGAVITRVDHDGPAGKAGLLVRDVVTQVNGQTVEGQDQFRKILRDLPAGHTVTLTVNRDGQKLSLTAQLANRAEVERRAWEQHFTVPEPEGDGYSTEQQDPVRVTPPAGHSFMGSHLLLWTPYTGLSLDVMGAQLAAYFGAHEGKGLLVQKVDSNSPAAVAGIHAGDVILRVNGVEIGSKSDWTRTMHDAKGHPATLTLLRERHELTVQISIDGKKRSSTEMPGDRPIGLVELACVMTL
jgi:S1-C subfamily serine protease